MLDVLLVELLGMQKGLFSILSVLTMSSIKIARTIKDLTYGIACPGLQLNVNM